MGGTNKSNLPFPVTREPPLDSTSTPISLSFPSHGNSEVGLIAQVKLCSPSNLNALRSIDFQQLISVLEWINEQPDILITIITGSGRYFSAGADVSDAARVLPTEITSRSEMDPIHINLKRQFYASRANMNNSRLGKTFFNHDKILVGAMNGPVVGISAALLAYCDFIYCFQDFFLLTPFTSLALVAEGGASKTFVKKMGLGRAQQALLEGRRMPANELLEAGFVSTVFSAPAPPANFDKKTYTPPIMDFVLPHITSKLLPPSADSFALLYTKNLIRNATYQGKSWIETNEAEIKGAETVFISGRPAKQFERVASKAKSKL